MGFYKLVDERVKYFKYIYIEPARNNLPEIVKTCSLSPKWLNEQDNESLFGMIIMEELETILGIFKRIKVRTCTHEIFLVSLYLLGD